MTYHKIITIEPGKRGGRPAVRGMRIASPMCLDGLLPACPIAQIVADYPELTEDDIRACLAYAADRERPLVTTANSKLLFDQNLSFSGFPFIWTLFPFRCGSASSTRPMATIGPCGNMPGPAVSPRLARRRLCRGGGLAGSATEGHLATLRQIDATATVETLFQITSECDRHVLDSSTSAAYRRDLLIKQE